MKRVLTCTTPYGVVSRTTTRTYTHVLVVKLADGSVHGLAWCGNQERAQAAFREWTRGKRLSYRFPPELLDSWEVTVFPVDKQ